MGWDQPIHDRFGRLSGDEPGRPDHAQRDGVAFKSHLDGSRHMLSPERSIEIQRLLGSSITMAFVNSSHHVHPRGAGRPAMERSMRWAKRSRDAFFAAEGIAHNAIFGLSRARARRGAAQGRRRRAARRGVRRLCGGAAWRWAKARSHVRRVLDFAPGQLDPAKPRYLMGVRPDDIVGAPSACWIDMFDCVLPTAPAAPGGPSPRRPDPASRNASSPRDRGPLDPLPMPVCVPAGARALSPPSSCRRDPGRDADDQTQHLVPGC